MSQPAPICQICGAPISSCGSLRSTSQLKTRAEVRQEFKRHGKTIKRWADENNFDKDTVYHVLSGKKVGAFGEAHRAAVLLGIKEGVLKSDTAKHGAGS